MRRLLLLLALPLLMASGPNYSATYTLQSTSPVTVQVALNRVPNGRGEFGIGGTLQCTNGYSAFDGVDDYPVVSLVFDETANVPDVNGLLPAGHCTLIARLIVTKAQGTTVYELGTFEFDV